MIFRGLAPITSTFTLTTGAKTGKQKNKKRTLHPKPSNISIEARHLPGLSFWQKERKVECND
jgi:hypothetical protein